jgi:ComF family protein
MSIFSTLFWRFRRWILYHGYTCDNCRAEVFEYPKTRLCAKCENKLYLNNQLTCPKCGRKTVANGVCLDCKTKTPAFFAGVSPFVYCGATAAFINRMKNGKRRLCVYFGERMADECLSRFPNLKEEKLMLVYTPLTKKKRRSRGYNQAEELAYAITQQLQHHGVAVELVKDVLQKRKDVSLQKRLGYIQRFENVQGSFHVHKRAVCRDKIILLIDDIMTTGATGHECARLLMGAGAKEVYFLTAASLQEMKTENL